MNKPLVVEEFGVARDGGGHDASSPTTSRDAFYARLCRLLSERQGVAGIILLPTLTIAHHSRLSHPLLSPYPRRTPGVRAQLLGVGRRGAAKDGRGCVAGWGQLGRGSSSRVAGSHQPSAISHEPSVISHQSSAISHQPSAISHPPSAISNQQSAIGLVTPELQMVSSGTSSK